MDSRYDYSALQSPLLGGARRGLILGAWLTCMFLLSMLNGMPLASLLFIAMAIGVPILVYRWLRATYVADKGFTTLSGLWMQGIIMFAGASLISTTVAVGYFKWVNPHYVADMATQMIAVYNSSTMSGAQEIAKTLQTMLDAGVLPTAQDVALEMFWLTMFCGSMLSLFASLVARSRRLPDSQMAQKTDIR